MQFTRPSATTAANKNELNCVLPDDRKASSQLAGTNRWKMAYSSMLRIAQGNNSNGEPLQKECIAQVWMPNWSHNSTFSAPSGVAIAIKSPSENAVISSHLFSDSSKFAYGTLAIPLPRTAKTAREGTPLVTFLQQLKRKGSSSSDGLQISSSELLDRLNSCVDSKLLEHPGGFAGIYTSQPRRYDFSERLWVVVQEGDAAASESCYNLVKEEGEEGLQTLSTAETSWQTNFEHSTSPFRKAKEASRRRRLSLANRIMSSTGGCLDMDHENRDISAYNPITTITNVFFGASSNTCVYYSGCTPVKLAGEKGQILLNESPRTGIFVLEGVKPLGKYLDAFPYGTGRIASLAPFSVRQRSNNNNTPPPPNVFVWETDDNRNILHPRLHYPASDLFRLRNKAFREMEIKLGRNPTAKVVHLRPVAVKLADPKRRKGGAKKTTTN